MSNALLNSDAVGLVGTCENDLCRGPGRLPEFRISTCPRLHLSTVGGTPLLLPGRPTDSDLGQSTRSPNGVSERQAVPRATAALHGTRLAIELQSQPQHGHCR